MKPLKPVVMTDGGPWCKHNMPCAVYPDEHAVLQMNTGVFHPSWRAQREGWMLVKLPRWVQRIVRWLRLDERRRV